MVTPTTAATTGPVNQIKMKSKLYVQTYVATSRRQCSCMRYGSVLECFSTECRKNQNQSNHNGQSEVREIPLRTNENSKQTTWPPMAWEDSHWLRT